VGRGPAKPGFVKLVAACGNLAISSGRRRRSFGHWAPLSIIGSSVRRRGSRSRGGGFREKLPWEKKMALNWARFTTAVGPKRFRVVNRVVARKGGGTLRGGRQALAREIRGDSARAATDSRSDKGGGAAFYAQIEGPLSDALQRFATEGR